MNRQLISSILKKHKYSSIAAIVCAFIYSVSSVLSTLQIGKAIDFMAGVNAVNFAGIFKLLPWLILIYFADSFSSLVVAKVSAKLSFSAAVYLRQTLYEKLIKLPLAFFDTTQHGTILSNFTNDVDNISNALSAALTHLITGATTIILLSGVMFYTNYRLAIIVLLSAPLTFIVAKLVGSATGASFKIQQEKLGAMTGFITEKAGNQKTIAALNNQQAVLDDFERMNKDYKVISTTANFAAAMVNPSARIVDHLTYLVVGIAGAFLAVHQGLTIGVVSIFLIFSGQFSKPFNDLSSIIGLLQTAKASLNRIQQTLSTTEEIANSPNAKKLRSSEGKLAFEDVSFSYQKSRPLIEKLSFTAEPGNLIAIVGPTGAGKTTLVNLIMRFYEIDSGNINIDDIPITQYTKESLRRNFGMVLQESWLFKGTVFENIAYGKPNATIEEVWDAAKSAHIAGFINKLPKQYDSIVEEAGANLSEGEKQLLTIARVMLTDPDMLILDEATSSIDTLTEIRVQKAFLELMKNRTSFVIAHRLSTIAAASQIIVLDNGRIVEIGPHDLLIAKKGFYYDLYQSQYK